MLVDLTQPIGKDRQQGHVVTGQNPCDALFDAVTDDLDGGAKTDDVVDEVGEVRVNLNAVEIGQQLGRRGFDQRQLAAQALTRTDVTLQPLVFDRFPAGVGETLKNVVDDVGTGNGPVEITHDMPLHHLHCPVEKTRLFALATGHCIDCANRPGPLFTGFHEYFGG